MRNEKSERCSLLVYRKDIWLSLHVVTSRKWEAITSVSTSSAAQDSCFTLLYPIRWLREAELYFPLFPHDQSTFFPFGYFPPLSIIQVFPLSEKQRPNYLYFSTVALSSLVPVLGTKILSPDLLQDIQSVTLGGGWGVGWVGVVG